MNLAGFAEHLKGEFVVGCLIATVDGKRQYLHRDGKFTTLGQAMYNEWEGQQSEPPVAIDTTETPPRKSHKSMRNDHGS